MTFRTLCLAAAVACAVFLVGAVPDMSNPLDMAARPLDMRRPVDMARPRPDLARVKTMYEIAAPAPTAWAAEGVTLSPLGPGRWSSVVGFVPPASFPVGTISATTTLRTPTAENVLYDAAAQLDLAIAPPAKSPECSYRTDAPVVTVAKPPGYTYCGATSLTLRVIALPSGAVAELVMRMPATGGGAFPLRGAAGLGWPLPAGTSSLRWVIVVRGRVDEIDVASVSGRVVETR